MGPDPVRHAGPEPAHGTGGLLRVASRRPTSDLWSNRVMTGEPVLDVVRRALTQPVPPAEDAARRDPPYPTPAALRDDEAVVRAALAAAGSGSATRPTVRAVLGEVTTFAQAVRLLDHGPFSFVTATGLLLTAGALGPDDVESLVPAVDRLRAQAWRRQLVLNRLVEDDPAAAAEAADAMDDRAFAGYRDIGAYHAARGDAPAFFALWRRYESSREQRFRMADLKRDLVRAVGARDGWAAAVELTRDRRIGPKFAADAFAPWAASGDVEGLLAGFDAEASGVLGELDELGVLVAALVAAAPAAPETDVEGLAAVYARLRAVDPTQDKATMRRRDFLLSTLWPAIGEPATLQAVRATIRTPQLRSELKELARDVR